MEDNRQIALVQNDSAYDMQKFVIGQVKNVLEARDYQVDLFAFEKMNTVESVREFIEELVKKKEYAYVSTLDMTGFEKRLTGDDTLYNKLYCPMINILTKDAWYYSHYLDQRLNFNMFFYHPYQYSVDYIRETFLNFPNIDLLAPVGFSLGECREWKDRTIDIYYPASYVRPSDLKKQMQELPQVFRKIADSLVEQMLAKEESVFYEELKSCLKRMRFECSEEELVDILKILEPVPAYVKMYYEDQCVRQMLRAGLQITVSGRGWKDFQPENGKMPVILGENGLTYEEMLRTMGNAKIVFNNQAHKRTNPHVRILNGMMQGALCVTDCFRGWKELFEEDSFFVTYSDAHTEAIPELIIDLQKEDRKMEEMASRGKLAAEQKFSLEKLMDCLFQDQQSGILQ